MMEVAFIPTPPQLAPVSSLGLVIQVRTTETEMDKEKGKKKKKSCCSQIVSSLSILSESHDPRNTNIKSTGNLNDMQLIIGDTALSQPPDLPPKTKPLSLPKQSTNIFSFKSCF
jgi:hypothetical protein